MVLLPVLTIGDGDVSRYLLTAHCEQTANQSKDPGKYDLTLANIGGKFTGAFAPTPVEQLDVIGLKPKKKVSLQIINRRKSCDGSSDETVTIFSGEIQKAEADEVYCRIEGSCSEGGMTSGLKQAKVYEPGVTITFVANDLLNDFGIPQSKRHIYPKNDKFPDKTPEYNLGLDFDTAFYELSQQAQSIYFFDDQDDFWLVPAADYQGFQDLTGCILRGSSAATMVGHCNQVNVFGGSQGFKPSEDGSEIKTHNLIHAQATGPQWDIDTYGLVVAPPVYVPNCDQAECQKIADNLLQWYLQYKDVPQVKVVGGAPGLLSKVSFLPWNGNPPSINCDGLTGATMGPVMGLVTRRVVDISADGGFICTLDVATNFIDAGVYDGDATGYYQDSRIVNKYPGVTIPSDSKTSMLLSPSVYAQAIKSAQAKNPAVKYSTLQSDPSQVLVYNPVTQDGKFVPKIDASFTGGYSEAYPQVGTNTTLSGNIQAICDSGWPAIEGV